MKREDFTTWTEYDPGGFLAVESNLAHYHGPPDEGGEAWLYRVLSAAPSLKTVLVVNPIDTEGSVTPKVIWGLDLSVPSVGDTVPELGLDIVTNVTAHFFSLHLYCTSLSTSDDSEVFHDGGAAMEITIQRSGASLTADWGDEIPHPKLSVVATADTLAYIWCPCIASGNGLLNEFTVGPLDIGRRHRRALLTGGGLGTRRLRTGGRF